jgi:hypothetical protein
MEEKKLMGSNGFVSFHSLFFKMVSIGHGNGILLYEKVCSPYAGKKWQSIL